MNINEIITDTIELMQEMRFRAEKAERERDEAIKTLSEEAMKRGEAEGRLEASEMAGVVDGWKSRAEAAEAKVVRLREALEPFALIAEWDIGDDERDGDQFHQVAPRHAVAGVLAVGHFRAAIAAMEATDE